MEEASEWRDNQPLKVLAPPTASRRNGWIPPPLGTLKCNIDASWNKLSSICGVGWILRDDAGEVRWLGAKSYPRLSSPLEAEAAAVTWASMCLSNLGYSSIQMESDCQSLVAAVSNPSEWPALAAYTADIKDFQQARNFSLPYSNRLGNMCADLMSKTINLCPVYFAVLEQYCPSWLISFVETDKHSLAQL